MAHLAIGMQIRSATGSFGGWRYCHSATRMLIPVRAGIQAHSVGWRTDRRQKPGYIHELVKDLWPASDHVSGRRRVVGSREHLVERLKRLGNSVPHAICDCTDED
jgi:hypothetical protein